MIRTLNIQRIQPVVADVADLTGVITRTAHRMQSATGTQPLTHHLTEAVAENLCVGMVEGDPDTR